MNTRVVPCRPDSLWLDVEVLRRVSAVILRDVFKQVRTSFVHLGVSRVVSEETSAQNETSDPKKVWRSSEKDVSR